MAGTNRFAAAKVAVLGKHGPALAAVRGTCVFVSHKREDAEMARDVADALRALNVDVWLDVDELDRPEPRTASEEVGLTAAIEAGLRNSSHLLALITPRTRGSWWVPFEIGSCRALARDLAFLVHKSVRDTPSYFKLGDHLGNQQQFLAWAKKLSPSPASASVTATAELAGTRLDPYLTKGSR